MDSNTSGKSYSLNCWIAEDSGEDYTVSVSYYCCWKKRQQQCQCYSCGIVGHARYTKKKDLRVRLGNLKLPVRSTNSLFKHSTDRNHEEMDVFEQQWCDDDGWWWCQRMNCMTAPSPYEHEQALLSSPCPFNTILNIWSLFFRYLPNIEHRNYKSNI